MKEALSNMLFRNRFWIACAIVVILVGCGQTHEREATNAFNQWVSYIMGGKIEDALKITSRLMKARWLYRIYEPIPFSQYARDRYKEIPKELVPVFDTWIALANSQFLASKSMPSLPIELAESEWFITTIKGHYEQGRETIEREFRGLQLLETAVEFNQASLVVRTADGVTQMYIIRLEDGVWKVDWNKPQYGG